MTSMPCHPLFTRTSYLHAHDFELCTPTTTYHRPMPMDTLFQVTWNEDTLESLENLSTYLKNHRKLCANYLWCKIM